MANPPALGIAQVGQRQPATGPIALGIGQRPDPPAPPPDAGPDPPASEVSDVLRSGTRGQMVPVRRARQRRRGSCERGCCGRGCCGWSLGLAETGSFAHKAAMYENRENQLPDNILRIEVDTQGPVEASSTIEWGLQIVSFIETLEVADGVPDFEIRHLGYGSTALELVFYGIAAMGAVLQAGAGIGLFALELQKSIEQGDKRTAGACHTLMDNHGGTKVTIIFAAQEEPVEIAREAIPRIVEATGTATATSRAEAVSAEPEPRTAKFDTQRAGTMPPELPRLALIGKFHLASDGTGSFTDLVGNGYRVHNPGVDLAPVPLETLRVVEGAPFGGEGGSERAIAVYAHHPLPTD